LAALQGRIDDIMLGKAPVVYERMLMQLDSKRRMTSGKLIVLNDAFSAAKTCIPRKLQRYIQACKPNPTIPHIYCAINTLLH
jgi:chloramphenicol 3-O-phosphotransferase